MRIRQKRRYFDNDSMFLHVPDPNRSTAENILHLIRPTGEFNDDEAKLLDRCLILHAEHGGGNNSTFTVRVRPLPEQIPILPSLRASVP